MKHSFWSAAKLSACCLVLCSVLYPAAVFLIGLGSPGAGNGQTVRLQGRIVGFRLIGEKFSQDRYFWGRPSAVGYNGAESGASYWGPSNPLQIQAVRRRLDTFLAHDPGIRVQQVPADLLTASASGLDPDISPRAAYIQVSRIARVRGIAPQRIRRLVASHVNAGWIGPDRVNVLELNVALDTLH